jgi:hypothetical protein
MAQEQDHHWAAVSRTALDPLRADDRPDEAFEASWRRAYRRRLLMVGTVLAVWTAGIEARLAYLQIVRHPHYLELANDQHNRVEELAPKRAEILDRNGEVLAYSVDADSVVVNPRQVTDVPAYAKALCAAHGGCSKDEFARISAQLSRKGAFAYLWRGESPAAARRVMDLNFPGFGSNSKRSATTPVENWPRMSWGSWAWTTRAWAASSRCSTIRSEASPDRRSASMTVCRTPWTARLCSSLRPGPASN